MTSGRRIAALAFAGLAVVLCSSLGAWQVWRGQARQHRLDADAAQAPQALRGTFLGDRQLLLDGQAHEGTPGYHVWTALRLDGGDLALVDRGWVPQPAPAIAAPVGEVTVTGMWRPLPQPAIKLAAAKACPAASFPAVVEYPGVADLRCLLGASVRDGVLLLDPLAPGGYVRQWNSSGFPPARHYAYAAQWFGLAMVAAVVLFRMARGSRA